MLQRAFNCFVIAVILFIAIGTTMEILLELIVLKDHSSPQGPAFLIAIAAYAAALFLASVTLGGE